MDTGLWPKDADDLRDFGCDELDTFISVFEDLMNANDVDIDLIREEWVDLKMFWLKNLLHFKTYKAVWKSILGSYRDKFPNISHVILILLTFPVSNAKVERGFSAMGRVKTDWRSSLKVHTLDCLLRITLEGKPLQEFDSTAVVKKFFAKARRPNTVPYGCKKQKHDVVELSDSTDSDDEPGTSG